MKIKQNKKTNEILEIICLELIERYALKGCFSNSDNPKENSVIHKNKD